MTKTFKIRLYSLALLAAIGIATMAQGQQVTDETTSNADSAAVDSV